MAVKFKPWDPFGTPPRDRYDPALDAQESAGQRGLGDLAVDAGTGNTRDLQDFGFAQGDFAQTRLRGHEDIQTQREDLNRDTGRGLADLDRTQGRNQQDYNRNVSLLQRSFRQLGNRQGQQARVMGVAGGGALLAAARKRSENQAIDRQPLDTSFNRASEDIGLQKGRMQEDQNTNLGRLGRADTRLDADVDTGLGRLGVNFQRGVDDRSTQLTRAGREQVFLGVDTGQAKSAQAAQTGWDPGARPSNEFMGPAGPQRAIVRGNTTFVVGPDGNVISKRPKRVR